MFTPTPLQTQLLKAVQNLSADNRRLINRSHADGNDRLPAVTQAHIEVSIRAREHLEDVSIAVGIPRSIVDYHRVAGERGSGFEPGQPMLSTEFIARGTLLAGYQALVHDLQDAAGIGATSAARGHLGRTAFGDFRRVIGVRWQRTGAIAHALELTAVERSAVWTRGATAWQAVVAEKFTALDTAALTRRLNEITRTDFSAAAVPVVVLQAAGIGPDDIAAQMPASPDQMVKLATHAVSEMTRQTALKTTGERIDAAIDAVGNDSRDDSEPEPHRDPGPGLAPKSTEAGRDP
ncbi:hypothetical protein ACFWUP_23710 [Nocardia sp. NPDC058658]|uniref:hypothetical protein n=1 Tax=Nocardia sp. NPDC058658 TaxID=3346580 RepID=UPI00364FB4B0